MPPGFPLADHVAAVYAVIGILAALRQGDRHGDGQFVDVSMFDVMTNPQGDEPLDQSQDEGHPQRTGNTDPRGAPVNVYPSADGWGVVMGLSDGHFARLCSVMGRPELASRLPDLAARVAAGAEIDAAVAGWTARLPTDEVARRLDEVDVPAAPVNPPWVTRDHPQTRARGMLVELAHSAAPGLGAPYRAARVPLAMSRTRLGASPPVEPLGASTERLLGEDRADT